MLVAIPLALLAIVGLPHLLRSPLVRMVVTHEPGSEPPGVTSPLFGLAFALLTGSRLTAGHAVAVLANGDATFPGLWRDLQSARRSITVQMYYAGPGTVIDTATQILTERAHAGVAVHFLYDAFGAKDLPPRHLAALRSAGARVAEFRPLRWYALDRASHRSHVRGIIIDGAIGYTGGFGFDDKWLGAGRRPESCLRVNASFLSKARPRQQRPVRQVGSRPRSWLCSV